MKCITNKCDKLEPVKITDLQLPKDYPWVVLSKLVLDLQDRLTQGDVELLNQIIRDRDFYAYKLLDDVWGLQSINTQTSGASLALLRARYQVSALLRKFQFKTDLLMRIDSAKTKLFKAESTCEDYNHTGYKKLVANGDFAAGVLTLARSFLTKLLGVNSPTNNIVVEWSRHGPGSSLDTIEGKSDAYNKYHSWPYSVTSGALRYARYLIATDQRWLGALEDDYREEFGIAKHTILDRQVFWDRVFNIVPGNRICFVPKNADTERSIAIEPTMNLMLQLSVDGFIRKRLKRWDINLDSQAKNQLLARRGSLDNSDQGLVTFDMSMASDTISLKLCEVLLPPEWFRYLCDIRSPQGLLDCETICYQKISSMGNGYTFALESAIFAALCSAAIIYEKGSIDWKNDLAVFGDDLIVPKTCYRSCLRALSIAGFAINTEKSFFNGPVRESCGCDWYQGSQIRPVFLKEPPESVPDLFVDRNRLKRILELRWGIEDSLSVKNLDRWVPEIFRNFTGPFSDEDFDTYLHSKFVDSNANYKNWLYVYRCLHQKAKKLSGRNFLFRKLMHDLRGGSEDPYQFPGKGKITVGGSRFDITSRSEVESSQSYSRTDYWCERYVDVAAR